MEREVPLSFGARCTLRSTATPITHRATLVRTMSDAMKYAVVAGVVSGGGLAVIANAPNPAGQAISGRHRFE